MNVFVSFVYLFLFVFYFISFLIVYKFYLFIYFILLVYLIAGMFNFVFTGLSYLNFNCIYLLGIFFTNFDAFAHL